MGLGWDSGGVGYGIGLRFRRCRVRDWVGIQEV